MRSVRFFCAAALAGFVSLCGQASAHHSNAAYDSDHPKTIEATVDVVNWTNPHITYQVTTANGEIWSLEVSSPGVMTRSGWSRHSLQPGDHAKFEILPLRSGGLSGFLQKVTLANGQVLSYSAPTDDDK